MQLNSSINKISC